MSNVVIHKNDIFMMEGSSAIAWIEMDEDGTDLPDLTLQPIVMIMSEGKTRL